MKTGSVPFHLNEYLGQRALKRIQSVEDNWMYYDVTIAALHMATAGFLDEANELLECLWKYKWPHSEDIWLPDQSFEVLWATANKRPAFVPVSSRSPSRSMDEIELAHRKYCGCENILWSYQMQKGSDFTWEMLPLGFRSGYRASPLENALPSAAQELEALAGLTKHIETYAADSRDLFYGDATCLAAELAARNGKIEEAIHFARLWAINYCEREGGGFNFPCMASNRHVAPLLLKGILAESLGLTKASCQSYLKNLKAAVNGRMKRGRKLAYGKWEWERLLKAASKRAIKADPDLFSKEERKSKWLGRPSASCEAISAAEDRLNVKLPSDYIEFLRASNGFSHLSNIAPALLNVEKIDRLKTSVDSEMINVLKDYPGEDFASAIESCILVSGSGAKESGTDMVLLIPPENETDQWQTWFFAPWVPGEMRFPSFRHYFEQTFQNLQSDRSCSRPFSHCRSR